MSQSVSFGVSHERFYGAFMRIFLLHRIFFILFYFTLISHFYQQLRNEFYLFFITLLCGEIIDSMRQFFEACLFCDKSKHLICLKMKFYVRVFAACLDCFLKCFLENERVFSWEKSHDKLFTHV